MSSILATTFGAALLPTSFGASAKRVSITCTGTVTVSDSGAGRATATCHGALAGTLKGSGSGSEVLPCIDYRGKGSISGAGASIAIRTAPNQHACFTAAPPTVVPVSGKVVVTGGTGTFAHAHGTLSFKASYNQDSGALSVKFTGAISR